MGVLRDNRHSVMAMLEAFVYDPLVDWAADRLQDEQRRGAEAGVSLGLSASRASWLHAASTMLDATAPSASLGHRLRAQAAPMHLRARLPQPGGGWRWPRELAAGRHPKGRPSSR